MPTYLSPGVYVEEVPSSARPIAGVGTSTAAFIGVVPDAVTMPTNPATQAAYTVAAAGVPVSITGWEQFKNNFGDFQAGNAVLAHAVYGFFNNGGTNCYVLRVTAATGNAAAKAASDTAAKAASDAATQATSDAAAQVASDAAAKTASDAAAKAPNDAAAKAASDAAAKAASDAAAKATASAAAAKTASAAAAKAASDATTTGSLDSLNSLLAKFSGLDDVSLVAVPGATSLAQHTSIYDYCFNAKNCFAILDGVQQPSDVTDPAKIEQFGASKIGTYGAVYFPWIQVYDPVTSANRSIPPSGHLAGIYARTDATRGVHKAPANENVLGALGLDNLLGKSDQDKLNPNGVNVIRSFSGAITVWGARTRADAGNSDFKYVNVRRLFIFLRKSIEVGTRWVVFEPNTPALWQSITRNVTDFLTNVWRSGALFGNTAQQAFYVKCDSDLNPASTRDLGQVVIEIGVAIVRPAEFVVFRIGQWTGPSQ